MVLALSGPNDLLTNAQRFEYLLKFLMGDALEVVKHKSIDGSYATLMKTLMERYG